MVTGRGGYNPHGVCWFNYTGCKEGLAEAESGHCRSSFRAGKCHGCSIDSCLVARKVLPSGCVVVELAGDLGRRCSLLCDVLVIGHVYCCEYLPFCVVGRWSLLQHVNVIVF